MSDTHLPVHSPVNVIPDAFPLPSGDVVARFPAHATGGKFEKDGSLTITINVEKQYRHWAYAVLQGDGLLLNYEVRGVEWEDDGEWEDGDE